MANPAPADCEDPMSPYQLPKSRPPAPMFLSFDMKTAVAGVDHIVAFHAPFPIDASYSSKACRWGLTSTPLTAGQAR